MGIINITPDSFYAHSRIQDIDQAIKKTASMLEHGATIIDIGAASSRPHSLIIPSDEEIKRVRPIAEALSKTFPNVWFSIDTYNSDTATMCVEEYGFYMINDISAYAIDPHMFNTITRLNVPYVLMHMQGTPENMQNNPSYNDVSNDVFQFLGKRKHELTAQGLNNIIIDPGFGFGKTLEHNYQLLKHLNDFRSLECPILVGLSRKSMVFRLLNIMPDESLNGTSALHTIAILNGADIIRTHDVKEAKEIIDIVQFYFNA
ncbi:MAG: dihydropteroate synthase [Bacteroidales bacterium]|nr:dihydropteroate synthase [Bacteroidales bacterium]